MSKKYPKYIFLDRDGVINKDPKTPSTYVTKWSEFHFVPGVKRALRKLTKAGYEIFVISNQAGVSKGYYTKSDLKYITDRMIFEINKAGGSVKKVLYCTHRNEDNCDCRKPKAGLFKKISKNIKIDFSKYYFIGDSERDITTARNAGVGSILVLCGKTDRSMLRSLKSKPDVVKKNLLEAVDWVLKNDCGAK